MKFFVVDSSTRRKIPAEKHIDNALREIKRFATLCRKIFRSRRSIAVQNDNLDTELLESFERLDDESISQDRFSAATDRAQTYLFNLNYAHETILPFEWIDYPGRIMRDKTDEDYPKVAKNINESSTLFICVNGEYLVGNDTERKIRNVKRKCSMTINRYFGKYFEAGGKLPPVGIILTKADLFHHDTCDEEIREILQEAFSPLFRSDRAQIGVIPVTLGENIRDDDYSAKLTPSMFLCRFS